MIISVMESIFSHSPFLLRANTFVGNCSEELPLRRGAVANLFDLSFESQVISGEYFRLLMTRNNYSIAFIKNKSVCNTAVGIISEKGSALDIFQFKQNLLLEILLPRTSILSLELCSSTLTSSAAIMLHFPNS